MAAHARRRRPGTRGQWGLYYGGVLTTQALARNSDVFVAGADLAGVHLWGNSLDTAAIAPLVFSPRALVLLTVVVALGLLASSDVLHGTVPPLVEAASGVIAQHSVAGPLALIALAMLSGDARVPRHEGSPSPLQISRSRSSLQMTAPARSSPRSPTGSRPGVGSSSV